MDAELSTTQARPDFATWQLVYAAPEILTLRNAVNAIEQRGCTRGRENARAMEQTACIEMKRAILLVEKATYDRFAHSEEVQERVSAEA
jgi:hypothetical protein